MNQIKKAGVLLARGELRLDDTIMYSVEQHDEVEAALVILDAWRAAHANPLKKATMGLRSRVQTATHRPPVVSQRLKRHYSIIAKLTREPTMKLPTMQDIAGCRTILDSVDEVYRVQRRWEQKGNRVDRVTDYIRYPKTSGYRGVHLVVVYDGLKCEVQIRTQLQHEWATTIERVGGRIGSDLKSGYGPPAVLRFFQAVSRAMAAEEADGYVPADLLEEVKERRQEAEPMMVRK